MSTYSSYDSCSRCSGGDQPGSADLAKYLRNLFPKATFVYVYTCRQNTAGGGLSIHACGRAIDFGVPTVDYGKPILALLRSDPARFGLQGIIFNRKRYDRRSPEGRTYTGPSPHTDHLHIEQDAAAARNLRYSDYEEKEAPLVTYRTVRNVPEESDGSPKAWAKDVVDDGITVGAINVTDTNPDDWEKPLTYGVLWTILDRLGWPKGSIR